MMAGAAARRIWALVYRHLVLYRRSWPRLLDIAYGPVLQLLIWGFTARFLAGHGGAFAGIAGLLIAGVLLWEAALASQLGFSVSFLEEIWSRNLGHLLVSPLRPWELIAALIVMSVSRLLAGMAPAVLLAVLLYAFDIFALGPVVLLLFANLAVMGWWVALGIVAFILRHGAGAEGLVWTVMFGLTPLSAVFYPVSALPAGLRPLALALPSAHVFEGLRAVLSGGGDGFRELAVAFALNLAWLAAMALLFRRELDAARRGGALVSLGE
jgi:ABC-2 type transport system permease protein